MKLAGASLMPRLLVVLALSSQLPLAAWADQGPALTSETPAIDTTQGQSDTPVASNVPMLTGQIHKSEQLPDDTMQGQLNATDAPVQAETPTPDKMTLRAEAMKKLQSGAPMTASDLRNLQVGIVGLDTVRTYYQNKARVSEVYQGCPAEQAGIRAGDIVMDKDHDDSTIKDSTVPSWAFSCGLAGDPYEVTLLKHGKEVTLHMTMMNMEDMPDPRSRHEMEKLVMETGYPAHNVPISPQSDFDDATSKATPAISPARLIFGLLGL